MRTLPLAGAYRPLGAGLSDLLTVGGDLAGLGLLAVGEFPKKQPHQSRHQALIHLISITVAV
jgi:hypothetical protein